MTAALRSLNLFALVLAAATVLVVASPAAAGTLPEPEQKIVYRCSSDSGHDLCMISPDGSGFVQLTNDSKGDLEPEISPTGRQIAWEHDITEIWVMDTAGGSRQNVTEGRNANFGAPSWSPGGDRLVMSCNDPAHLTVDGLCFINANGSDFQFHPIDDLDAAGVEWSRDGTKVLFTVETQSVNEDIFVLNLNTGNYDNITETGDDWEHPTWSPDGTKIAFVGSPIPADGVSLTGLYTIDPDGTNRERLFTPGSGAGGATNPAWSPDGSKIAFFCSHSGPGADELCIVDAASGNLLDVVSAPDDGFLFDIAAEPDWSWVGGVQQGDVDCNLAVNSVDSLKVLRHVAGLNVSRTEPCPAIATEIGSLWGDVDCGGDVNAVDALKLLRYVAGLAVSQTAPCLKIGVVVLPAD